MAGHFYFLAYLDMNVVIHRLCRLPFTYILLISLSPKIPLDFFKRFFMYLYWFFCGEIYIFYKTRRKINRFFFFGKIYFKLFLKICHSFSTFRDNRLRNMVGTCPRCLEIEASRHRIDVEHFSRKIDVFVALAFEGFEIDL